MDVETDAKIQETILREFKQKTLICIAHRLRTIINYQRIVVMDQGKIAVRTLLLCIMFHYFRFGYGVDVLLIIGCYLQEFDTPLSLFDQRGVFRSMCETSHITREDIEAAWRAAPWAHSV